MTASTTPSQQTKPAPLPPVLTTGTSKPPRHDAGEQGGNGPHWAEWALVFVTGLLAIYTYRLWRATKEAATEQAKITVASLGEMHRAADAARRSADVARDTLHLAYRAHLHFDTWSIENFQPNSVPVVKFDVLNGGHTAGELVGFRSAYDEIDPPPPAPEYREPVKPKYGLVRPSDTAPIVLSYEFQGPISQETFDAVVSGKRAVYIWGELVYRDTFGDQHRTRYGIALWLSRSPLGGWKAFPIDKPGYNYAD